MIDQYSRISEDLNKLYMVHRSHDPVPDTEETLSLSPASLIIKLVKALLEEAVVRVMGVTQVRI